MKKINNYIFEKLKINKDIKSDEYISGKEMFLFLKKYIFDQIQKVNTVNLSTFESFLTSFDKGDNNKFNINCLPEHNQIWGKKFDFINYLSTNEMSNKKISDINLNDNLYLGGGIYIWFGWKRNKIEITIADNDFNDFDHGFGPIIINRK